VAKEEYRIQEPVVRINKVKAKHFQDLIVWQKADQFVLAVYTHSKDFPKEETYGITSQLRRLWKPVNY
jgi:hypothetical protein